MRKYSMVQVSAATSKNIQHTLSTLPAGLSIEWFDSPSDLLYAADHYPHVMIQTQRASLVEKLRSKASGSILLIADTVSDELIRHLSPRKDDFVLLPSSEQELRLRLQRLLQPHPTSYYTHGPLKLSLQEPRAQYGQTLIPLTPLEHRILQFFFQRPNRILHADQIHQHIWDEFSTETKSKVAVHINAVRKKIDYRFDITLIETIRGLGYVLRK